MCSCYPLPSCVLLLQVRENCMGQMVQKGSTKVDEKRCKNSYVSCQEAKHIAQNGIQ